MQRPRSADGPIPFEILARVPVEEWAPNRAVAQPNIDRATPLIMRGSVVRQGEMGAFVCPNTARCLRRCPSGLPWASGAPRRVHEG